ncbi:PREDICTED: adenosine deaminase CECR1-like [Wasmannia auropunctata]|uniref:adenosine deaminase CECR1-like n=1 Tax=Wasmannia auropunctata TaxID=64793 RepID=UPI0005F04130|nr:PREDICTED: adenosine deaminase CECR1-like [Wasmannia auropunctata]
MARTLLFILAVLICGQTIFVHPAILDNLSLKRLLRQSPQRKTYWETRRRLILDEKRLSLGGELELSPIEARANQVLMRAKSREIYDGFITGNSFLPSRNFMEVIPKIEESEVFKILRDMPKGAVLHAHESAIASLEYRLNLTYRENLYVCDENSTLRLKFFNTSDSDCNWQLLSDVRKDPAQTDDINERIMRSLTMVTENPKSVYATVDKAWQKFDSIFRFMKPLVSYRPNYEDLYYRNLQELYDDNVMYAEIRSTLSSLYDLHGNAYGPMEMVQLHKDITDRFMKDHPDFIGAKMIYAPPRGVDQARVDYYLKTLVQIKKFYPDFVAGFDLVGQEDKGKPLIEFADKLNAVDPGIQFFFHAGETNWNGASTDMNLFDAFLLNTKRIGHGYALTKHPLLWKIAQRLNIAVEVCPISNQVLSLVEDMRNHPAASLFASGSPVVVSNDDPGLWGAKGLTYDFYEAFMGIMSANSDLRSLKQLAINSLTYSSMNRREKWNALQQWQIRWDNFVAKLAQLA